MMTRDDALLVLLLSGATVDNERLLVVGDSGEAIDAAEDEALFAQTQRRRRHEIRSVL